MKTDAQFYALLVPVGDCLEWSGAVDSRGYGNLSWNGRKMRAHRVAYEIANGKIPKGEGHHGTVVMHSCDNRLCCNPEHLSIGTHADNMADMAKKGRRKSIAEGESNGRCKLTEDQVIAIRKDTRGKRVIAPEYGVSPAQIQRIRNNQLWKSVP